MQHVSWLFQRARADQQKPGVRWRKYHVVDEVERSGFAEHLQMSRQGQSYGFDRLGAADALSPAILAACAFDDRTKKIDKHTHSRRDVPTIWNHRPDRQ
jgi:hypothetical protein